MNCSVVRGVGALRIDAANHAEVEIQRDRVLSCATLDTEVES
jgi:hypothetical protein